jgi:3-oxoacyl-[acyl-carrier protein] reductase
MSRLTGEVAVVICASKGIGAAIAKTLAADGAAVVVNYASCKVGADQVVQSIIGAGGKAVAIQSDVSKAADAKVIIEAAVANYGRLDILINNSGVYEFGPRETVAETQAAKSRPVLRPSMSLMVARTVAAISGPTPGMLVRRRAVSSARTPA